MSNFIDEAERHTELYNAFTPRQRFVLHALEAARQNTDQEGVRSALGFRRVTQSEIQWLERTGRLAPIVHCPPSGALRVTAPTGGAQCRVLRRSVGLLRATEA